MAAVWSGPGAKDSIVGHWEVMGAVTEKPFDTFPQGFPEDLLGAVRKTLGRDILDGGVASGTEIIARLGKVHQETRFPIFYTSADSVLQLAAHEETVPLSTLHGWCEALRHMVDASPYHIGRIIARPSWASPGTIPAPRTATTIPPFRPQSRTWSCSPGRHPHPLHRKAGGHLPPGAVHQHPKDCR